uniref:Uncharacterized protein n=1 Tax=Oryza barthii TaxID=65489 RepID=A0A0D3G579_9ORYZ
MGPTYQQPSLLAHSLLSSGAGSVPTSRACPKAYGERRRQGGGYRHPMDGGKRGSRRSATRGGLRRMMTELMIDHLALRVVHAKAIVPDLHRVEEDAGTLRAPHQYGFHSPPPSCLTFLGSGLLRLSSLFLTARHLLAANCYASHLVCVDDPVLVAHRMRMAWHTWLVG